MSKELWHNYWRLMRFDRPVGIALLWCPVAWALWLSAKGIPPIKLLLIFFLGTVIMRAAGCVLNDIVDRNIDKHVARTRLRPLTAGALSLKQALSCLFLLLFLAFVLWCTLPFSSRLWALAGLGITAIYPFCKRFFVTPQLILGLAFSAAIPMVYAANHQSLGAEGTLLIVLNILWVVAYDTEYAMVDRGDDLNIGIHSTAIFLGSLDCTTVAALFILMQFAWLFLAISVHLGSIFFLFYLLSWGNIIYQFYLIRARIPDQCFQAFLQNTKYGFLIWAGLVLHFIYAGHGHTLHF